jgi:hypothetical protein
MMGAPPLPPGMGGAPAQPGFAQLAGMGGGSPAAPTAGVSQISESAIRMGAEIDQALKLLAQAIPTLAPWVEKTVMEMRYQIGSALQSGAVPTRPVPGDNVQFPDGSGRL